jgi:outer membrane protein assembly factor BamB
VTPAAPGIRADDDAHAHETSTDHPQDHPTHAGQGVAGQANAHHLTSWASAPESAHVQSDGTAPAHVPVQPVPDGQVILLLDDEDLDSAANQSEAAGRHRDRKRSDDAALATVRMAPQRNMVTAGAVLLVVALVAAAALTFARKPAAAASPYSWDNLPAPLTSLPTKRWSFDLQGARLVDAVSNDETVLTATDDGTVSRISAHEARTGAAQWRLDLPADARVQRLVLADNDVVAVALVENSLRFSLLRLSNGTTRWTAVVGGRYSAVLAGADRVLVLTGAQPQSYERAAAYDRRNGEQVWARNAPVGQLNGGRVTLVDDRDVISVDIETGDERQRWTGAVAEGAARQPISIAGTATVLDGESMLVDNPGAAAPTSVAPGIGLPFTALPTGDHQVTVVSTEGIAAVDVASKQVTWARDLSTGAIGRAGGNLVLLGSYGQPGNTMVVVNASTGREVGFQRFDDIVPRRPLGTRGGYLADGAAYLLTTDGGIRAVSLPALNVLWKLDPHAIGGQARDVRAMPAGLLVVTVTGQVELYR